MQLMGLLMDWVSRKEDSIDANMWLSILDVAYRTNDDRLVEVARQAFDAKFDFESLSTEAVEPTKDGKGRRVKRVTN